MFFANHYAGYWKHGERGGSMFGVVHPKTESAPASLPAGKSTPSASSTTGDKSKQ
jgi:hypothetical protein